MKLVEIIKLVDFIHDTKIDLDRVKEIRELITGTWNPEMDDYTGLLMALASEEYIMETELYFDVPQDLFETKITNLFKEFLITKSEFMKWLLGHGIEKETIYFGWLSQFMEND